MNEVDKIERAGFTATLYYDESPASPEEWSTVGTLAYDARDASYNRDNLPRDPYDYGMFREECNQCNDGKVDQHDDELPVACEVCKGSGMVCDGASLAKRLYGATHVLPVYAYDDRMGTELHIADNWEDANGWIYATAESVAECIGPPGPNLVSDKVFQALKVELREWQKWAQGDVYGIVVTDPAGNETDSCWGFYGFDYAMEEPAVKVLEQFPAMSELKVN